MKVIKILVGSLVALISGLFVGTAVAVYVHYESQLPELDAALNYQPPVIAHVYDRNGVLLAEFSEQHRIPIALSEISPVMIDAILAMEDQNFYGHRGLDIMGILRAAWVNLKAGRIVQGGSTLTQQLAKSLFLTDERDYERKIKEAILAYRLEEELTKERILELYMNQVFFGSGAYGIESAAQRYFSKSASDLDLREAALLASLPKAPSRFTPLRNPELATERRNLVLQRMVEKGVITPQKAAETRQMDLGVETGAGRVFKAHYFVEFIRRDLEEQYGYSALYRSGWDIHTTLDYTYQSVAEKAVRDNLYNIEKRRRQWRGPVEAEQAEYPPEPGYKALSVITSVGENVINIECGGLPYSLSFRDIWVSNRDLEQLKPGDMVWFVVEGYLDEERTEIQSGYIIQEPEVDASLVSTRVETGEVLAWVGGYNFWRSQFDRVTQSQRQPGSAFKPLIYAQALESGYTAADIIYDTPIVVEKTWETASDTRERLNREGAIAEGLLEPQDIDELDEIEFWKPQNYGREFYGATTLREGLAKSRNIVSIHLMEALRPSNVIKMARTLGITSPLHPSLALALGSSEVTLMELNQAYSALANQGTLSEPLLINRIVDRDRTVIRESYPVLRPAVSAETAYLTTNLLSAVITEGTGHAAHEIGYPMAGKTGTTNNYYDAWFVGYTPYVATGVWVGVDMLEPIFKEATGASAALPIWKEFMKTVLQDYEPDPFPVPPNISFANVCRVSGKLSTDQCERHVQEAFLVGTAPLDYCNQCGVRTRPAVAAPSADFDWDSPEIWDE
jgi:penicillin-binding protein 1A